ncbi:MAG: InlB B-repeat-containing protein [bacterium]
MKILDFFVKLIIVIGLVLITAVVVLTCFGETKFRVTFDANNGTANTIVYVLEEGTVDKPETDPTKEGNTFLNWTLEGVEYNFETVVEDHITLIAAYDTDEYTINFDVNGGSPLTNSSITVNYGDTVTFETPTLDGKEFGGWFNGETKYTSGEWTTVLNEELTLTAKWLNVYTVSYELNGGANALNNPETYTEGTTVTLEDATLADHTFIGWFEEDTFENEVTTLSDLTANITLHAKFEETSNDGGATPPVTVTVEQLTTALPSTLSSDSDLVADVTIEGQAYDVTWSMTTLPTTAGTHEITASITVGENKVTTSFSYVVTAQEDLEVTEVQDLIDALEYTLVDASNYTEIVDAIAAINTKFEALTEDQKTQVSTTTLDTLKTLVDAYENSVAAIKEVQDLIDDLEYESVDDDNYQTIVDAITEIYTKYDALTEDQKTQVSTTTLDALETLVDEYEATLED